MPWFRESINFETLLAHVSMSASFGISSAWHRHRTSPFPKLLFLAACCDVNVGSRAGIVAEHADSKTIDCWTSERRGITTRQHAAKTASTREAVALISR